GHGRRACHRNGVLPRHDGRCAGGFGHGHPAALGAGPAPRRGAGAHRAGAHRALLPDPSRRLRQRRPTPPAARAASAARPMIHADQESAMPAAYAATPFAQRLGLTLPVVQAPMAGVSTPALAAAVSNAGGLGSLGLGAMNADAARQAIALTR